MARSLLDSSASTTTRLRSVTIPACLSAPCLRPPPGALALPEATGRTAATNATGMTSAGGTFHRERSGMSKVSFKTQATQSSKQSQRSRESQATRGSRQSQRSQRSRRSEQQPPRPPAALATSMPKTTTVLFEEPATRREQHRGGFGFFV